MTIDEIKSLIQQIPSNVNRNPRILIDALTEITSNLNTGGGGTSFAFTDNDGYDFDFISGQYFIQNYALTIEGHVQTIKDPNDSSAYYLNAAVNFDNTLTNGSGDFYPAHIEELTDKYGSKTECFTDPYSHYINISEPGTSANFSVDSGSSSIYINNMLFGQTNFTVNSLGGCSISSNDAGNSNQTTFNVNPNAIYGNLQNYINGTAVTLNASNTNYNIIVGDSNLNTASAGSYSTNSYMSFVDDFLSGLQSSVKCFPDYSGLSVLKPDAISSIYATDKEVIKARVGTAYENYMILSATAATLAYKTLVTNDISTILYEDAGIALNVTSISTGFNATIGIKRVGGNGKVQPFITNLTNYADLASATTAGLVSGDLFRIGHQLCVVP